MTFDSKPQMEARTTANFLSKWFKCSVVTNPNSAHTHPKVHQKFISLLRPQKGTNL